MIKGNIIIDSKSGYSGAGKNFRKKFPYKNFSSNYMHIALQNTDIWLIDQSFKSLSSKNMNYIFNPQIIPTFREYYLVFILSQKRNIRQE